jgi:hypothetical protein
MRRAIMVVGCLAGLALLISAAPAPKQPVSPAQKINQRIDYPGVEQGKTTLAEVLDRLTKLSKVHFGINEQGFKLEGVMDVASTPITADAALPEMKNARLNTVLRMILRRIPVPSGATYYVRDDYIEITTGAFQAQAIWGSYGGPHLPLVYATLDNVPLQDAVRELAEQTEFNIVVDNRAAEKAKTPVSARLTNTPLDTALRLLTDMADLRYVHIDNVLYVTTKENAAALDARLEKEKTPPTTPLDDNAGNGGEFRPRKGVGPDNIKPNVPEGAA